MMRRKLSFLTALAVAILCTGSAWAQSAISVGTNLDFSEGTPVDNGICTYAKDMATNNTSYSHMLEVSGWQLGVENGDARAAGLFAYGSGNWLGGTGYNVPATNPVGIAEGNALGILGVWSGTVQYVQPVTLEAGNYVINVLLYNAVGGTSTPTKGLIGFIADNGKEYLAPKKAYPVNTWTVETITFTLEEATSGKLSMGYTAPNSGAANNLHLFIDKVEILAVTETDLARADLNAALVSAQSTVDAKANVGAGLFMYSEEVYNAYAAAVADAKAVSENAESTKEVLVEALAALNAATEAYVVTLPAADAIYAIKHNASGNYLTITDKISIEAGVDTLSFEAAGNGKYYIRDNAGKYIFYSGTGDNKWSLSASASTKHEWTVSVNAEGLYSLVGKNGGLGTDNVGAGSNCYGNKDKSAANSLWTIEEIVAEEEPEQPEEPEIDPNDYTSYIVNADLSTADAWNVEGTKGISGGMVKVASESAFDFSQTITLPAGQYKMTAKAAYRYTGSEQEEYDAIQAGTETHLVKLYAETSSYTYEGDVMNRWEGASETNLAGDGVSEVNGKFVPNSSNAVLAWFNAGQYVNELVFNVQEEAAVKIGITRVGGIAGDYTNIGAWTLTRVGDAEADPEVEEPEPEEPETPEEPGDEPEATVDFDVTDKVNKSGWIVENGSKNTVTIDGIAMTENYQGNSETTGIVLWQDVTGLENGNYTVELWANARVAWVASTATDGQEDLTYLVANNVEISMQVLLNPGLNNNATYVLEGVEVTDGTLHIEMNKKAAGSNWHTIQIKSLTYHATNEVIVNLAKVDLKAALDAANAVEPKKDDFVAAIAAAQDVYDNSKVVEEIEAATATLKEATKLAILGNASPSNPVLTDFVINGTFDAGTAPWQTTTGAQNKGTATNQQGAFTGSFFENWNPSAVTGKLYQVIENVPNGIYDLSICAFVNNFDGAVQFVYANADKVALTTGEPTAYTVRTIVENNTIEVGFEQTEAVANWMGIDNVSLTYLGEYSDDAEVNMAKANFTAAYDEFNAALAACQAMMLKGNFYEVADAADQLNAQLESTTDIEALNAMVAQLNEATASLNEINAVYAEYNVYVQKFMAATEFSEPLTTEAAELLESNMYGNAGMQATSIEDLKQAIEQIKADYLAYAGNAKLHDGHMFDFTYLIQNPDFEANLDGWTANKANRIGGEGYDGVGGIAEIGEWGASSWDASMSQAITGLPNGKYVVKAAWMSATGIEMTFAANAGSTTVTGIGDTGGNIAKDGSVVEMGQGHRGWQYVEVEGLVEDGTLTILVSSSSATQYQWSNADAFELYYAGVPAVVEPEYLTVVGAKVGDVEIVEGAATVESISSFEITFDRPVALAENEDPVWATLTDSWGDNSLKAEVLEDNNCVVRFSLQWDVYTDAGDYYLYIPEGIVVGAEDTNYINAAIEAVITIEGGSVEPATPLAFVNVTVGEDVMEGFTVVATIEDMIKVNFDGKFYFQGSPVIVDAEGNDASEYFQFLNGLDYDGSNSYIFMPQNWEGTAAPEGIYTITLPKAQFNELEMMGWKAPAEDIVLTVQIGTNGIENIEAAAEAVIYDLSGRRVEKMTRGIYIVNGKKVFVK